MKYEYLRKTLPYPINSNESDKFLDDRGSEGWEIVKVEESDRDPYSTLYLFKRPIEEVIQDDDLPDMLIEEIPDEELPDDVVKSRKSWMYKIYKIFKEKSERYKYGRH